MPPPACAVDVRRARDASERAAALALRRRVFCAEQGVPLALEVDGRDDRALHLVAVEGGVVLGTCRLLFDGPTAKLGRLAVAAPARGRGLGTALVAAAEAEARAGGAQRLALNAQLRATRLYAERGFVVQGAPFPEAGIEHVKMDKCLG